MANEYAVCILLLLTASVLPKPSSSTCVLDKCGVCNGNSRACCSFRGLFNSTACVCDSDSSGKKRYCGVFCHLEFDGCQVCDGDGRSCCRDGTVRDSVTQQCGPRRYYLDVFAVPSNPDGQPVSEVIAVTHSEPSSPLPPRMRLPADFHAFPGPTIRAIEGESLAVTVHNRLLDRIIDIHWHGLHHQNNAWVDGNFRSFLSDLSPLIMLT